VNQGTNVINARFGGSPKSDVYTVYVEVNNEVVYESSVSLTAKSEITGYTIETSASDDTVSSSGGDIIKITGTGFADDLTDNQVVLGEAKATVLSSNFTEIRARTSAGIAEEVELKVFLKASIEADCPDLTKCSITYDSSLAPTLASNEVLEPENGIVTITGTGFGANPVGYVNGFAQNTVSASDTEIQIELIKVNDNERMTLEVRSDTVNLPLVNVANLTHSLISVTPNTGSSGGQLIQLKTTGLGMETTGNIKVLHYVGNTPTSLCESIEHVSSSEIHCFTRPDQDYAAGELKIEFVHDSSQRGTSNVLSLSCSTASD
jgi:hypothetical protein